ncbi:MAG TPA: hypothetical protein VGR35_23285 [Tepidisphaeraceae bacterium]|nr:hypothetical protein [Tepidisphaeraceae bacterium]
MDHGTATIEPLDRFTSWAAFLLLVVSATAFAWYVPRNRDATLQIFLDFGLKLPRSTAVACNVPTVVIVGLSAVSVVGALVVQLRSRSRRSASLFHLLLVFILGTLFLMHREAMGNAFLTLVEAVSGPPAAR